MAKRRKKENRPGRTWGRGLVDQHTVRDKWSSRYPSDILATLSLKSELDPSFADMSFILYGQCGAWCRIAL